MKNFCGRGKRMTDFDSFIAKESQKNSEFLKFYRRYEGNFQALSYALAIPIPRSLRKLTLSKQAKHKRKQIYGRAFNPDIPDEELTEWELCLRYRVGREWKFGQKLEITKKHHYRIRQTFDKRKYA